MANTQRWTRRDWLTMVESAAAVIIIVAVIAGVIAVVGGGSSSKQTVGGGGSGDGGRGVDGWFVGTSIGDAGYQTQLSTSPNGTAWTARQLKEPLTGGLAWANGKWLALSLVGETSVLESTDLRSWSSVTTVPAKLHDIAYGDGQWIAVGGESDNDIGHGVVYASTDGRDVDTRCGGRTKLRVRLRRVRQRDLARS